MTDLSRMKQLFFFTGINKFKSTVSTATLLIILSFFIIGGCNDSGSNPNVDARTIGSIEGTIVPAVKEEFALQRWQEGDPDGNIFLNGSRVNGLTQSEQDALNNAYQSGFFVSLISPEIEDIEGLLDVLGLQQLIRQGRPIDLYAVARNFNVSGVRHFRIDAIDLDRQVAPVELSFQIERVERFITWADDGDQTQLASSVRETGDTPMQLTNVADSVSHTMIWSWTAGKSVIAPIEGRPNPSLSDFEGHFQVFLEAWSVHSVEEDKDFYFFRTDYSLEPNTTLRSSPTDPWPCQAQQPPKLPLPLEGYEFPMNPGAKGVTTYDVGAFTPSFGTPAIINLESDPQTSEPTVSTTSSISRTISGSVSFSSADGAGIGVSDSITYSNSKTYTSAAITTTNLNNEGTNANNAEWVYDVVGSNVTTSTFLPTAQWVLEADSSTRTGDTIELVPGISFTGYLISCAAQRTLERLPDPSDASEGPLYQWPINIPVPPLPPSN